jgi:membrane protein YdbS with pleckstrin-like domain
MPPEETLWEGTPALKLLAMDAVVTGIYAVVLSVVVYLGYGPALHFLRGLSRQAAETVTTYEASFRLAAIAFVLVMVGRRIGALIWRGLALRGHRYRLSNQRLVLESGVLSKSLTEIDIRTVEEVSFHQSFSERLLGLGRISLVASSPALAAVPGLRRPGQAIQLLGVVDPRAVREKIRDAAYAATGNQVFMRST